MLVFLPTPIGNLGDISFRFIQILKEGEIIFCEDTRVTKKLIQLVSKEHSLTLPDFQYISLHSHNEKSFLNEQSKQLFLTKKCIYMSDAGMPCVSDPGSLLVDFCLQNQIEYDVIPGANALLTAYAGSGFSNTSFSFFGFLPHKGQNRKDQLQTILNNSHLSILYESPHRLLKLLEELAQAVPNRTVFLTKELTKMYQKRYKGTAKELYEDLKKEQIRGEWVVIIENDTTIESAGVITVEDIEDLKLPPKQKAKLLAKLTGKNIKEIYNSLIG
jgi:16S rRNA (cytidine1402-2'-O)-methyltransferase